jgi:uncharacterized protein DUF4124
VTIKRSLALLAIAALLTVAPAHAQVYKSVDEQGRVIYTDKPSEGAKKIDLPSVTTMPGTKPPPKVVPADPGRAGGKRMDGGGQDAGAKPMPKALDGLSEAERRLEAARKELADQEAVRLGDERHNYQKYLDRIEPYREAVQREEEAVDAARREAGVTGR